jgi:hypothetical protein
MCRRIREGRREAPFRLMQRPLFGGTFFVFSDYLRPAIRLASLMGLPVTYVFTHDNSRTPNQKFFPA